MSPEPRSGGKPSPQKRRQRVRKELMEQGLKLIGQRGLAAAKVEQITAAAGVGKGTFFTHFASKEAFVAHLVDGVLDDLARRVTPLGLMPTDARELLSGVGAVHLRYFQLRPEAAALLAQAPGLDPEHEASGRINRRLAEYLDTVGELLRPAGANLGWPAERMSDLALMILATSTGFFWLGRDEGAGRGTPADLLDRLGRALGRGLAGG